MDGSMILSAFGNGRVARLVTNGNYLAAVGVFISLALMLFKQSCEMVACRSIIVLLYYATYPRLRIKTGLNTRYEG